MQPRSLSEAVGGVHGGKYQFGPGSFTGDAFAAALASSSSEDCVASDSDGEPWPAWARELKPTTADEEPVLIKEANE